MTLQINKIYKVKEGHEGKCNIYSSCKRSCYIKFQKYDAYGRLEYTILDKDKNKIVRNGYNWCNCFTEDDLEPLEEEVKEKSLDNLEVGDENDVYYNLKETGEAMVDSVKDVANAYNSLQKWLGSNKRININENPIKELSLSEAETLLEEKLGIKVKIKK